MKLTIVLVIISSIILTMLTFGYNYVNICVSDLNNNKYSISECIDNNLINSILILISGIGIIYIAILLLKLNTKPDDTERQKILDETYDYYKSKRIKENNDTKIDKEK